MRERIRVTRTGHTNHFMSQKVFAGRYTRRNLEADFALVLVHIVDTPSLSRWVVAFFVDLEPFQARHGVLRSAVDFSPEYANGLRSVK
jgi:hypothetical protein